MAREGAVGRAQADRADAHRDERAKVCVVLAWIDHVDQCKKHRMDIVTADDSAWRFMFSDGGVGPTRRLSQKARRGVR